MGMVRNHDDLSNGGGGAIHEGAGVRRISEWEKQPTLEHQQPHPRMELGGIAGGSMYVKVMTDEQLELLRRQICAYATLSEQLVEMHRAISAQQELDGMRSGNMCCESLMTSAHKFGARQRWNPCPLQRDMLERLFKLGNGTPSKQKIKDITADLSQHGPITETNVYNWFQNRRARSKKKSAVGANGAEFEADTDVESRKYKKMKRVKKDEAIFPGDHRSRSSDNLVEQYFSSSNRRMDQLFNKMEDAESFSLYGLGEEFDIVG